MHGRWLAFISTRAGHNDVWRMELGAGGLKQLTSGTNTSSPCFTPDGNWVVYATSLGDKITLWKAPLEGGAPAQLTEQYSHFPALSPDGKLIAYIARNEQLRGSLAVIPFEGGPALKTF